MKYHHDRRLQRRLWLLNGGLLAAAVWQLARGPAEGPPAPSDAGVRTGPAPAAGVRAPAKKPADYKVIWEAAWREPPPPPPPPQPTAAPPPPPPPPWRLLGTIRECGNHLAVVEQEAGATALWRAGDRPREGIEVVSVETASVTLRLHGRPWVLSVAGRRATD